MNPVLINFHMLCGFLFLLKVQSREATFEIFGKVMKVDKFLHDCPGGKSYPVYFKDITGYGEVGKMTFNYVVVSKTTADNPMFLMVETQRCQSKENPDSCIRFAAFRTGRLCQLLQSGAQFWSPMIDCTTPKMGCPLYNQTYIGSNCTLDMSGFNWFPLGDSYWKLRVELSTKTAKNLIACAIVEGKIFSKH